MSEWTVEILQRYGQLLMDEASGMLLAGLAGGALCFVWWRSLHWQRVSALTRSAWLHLVVALGALSAGLWLAVQKAAVYDDAYISFRFADNLLHGHGLVWNPGERVEGYTNFLWTFLLAVFGWLTPLELPLLALGGCLLSFAGVVLLVAHLGRRIYGAGVPLAALLYALQDSATEYATSGLETSFATLCVLLGLGGLVAGSRPRHAALAGAGFMGATFTRPDHCLFWIAGALALLWELRRLGPADGRLPLLTKAAWLRLGCYASSFVPYLAYLGWKVSFYGRILPNTYFAKSAGLAYFDQGGIYALTFLLGSHLWLVIPLALFGLLRPRGRAQRLMGSFALVSLPLYNFYVLKVGGDFMYGRFYVVTLPIWLLLAQGGVRRLLAAGRWRGILAASLLWTTVGGVRLMEGTEWNIALENAYYRITQCWPRVAMDHPGFRVGVYLGAFLKARGIEPVIATPGIGMVGYYSRLELIDLMGLTDRRVAHTKLDKRGKPGHEKWPRERYLERRGVQLIHSDHNLPRRWHRYIELNIGGHHVKQWRFYCYDVALADQLRDLAPEIRFTRFEPVLDAWLARAHRLSTKRIEEDAAFFQQYYFRCNEDAQRAARVDEARRAASRRGSPSMRSAISPAP